MWAACVSNRLPILAECEQCQLQGVFSRDGFSASSGGSPKSTKTALQLLKKLATSGGLRLAAANLGDSEPVNIILIECIGIGIGRGLALSLGKRQSL